MRLKRSLDGRDGRDYPRARVETTTTMDAANETARLIRRLVVATATRARDDDGEDVGKGTRWNENHDGNGGQQTSSGDGVDAGCRYAARVLGSTLGASTATTTRAGDGEDDVGTVIARISRRVGRTKGKDAGAAVADACERLRRGRGAPKNACGVLRALLAVSEDAARGNDDDATTSGARAAALAGMSRLDLEGKARALAREARVGRTGDVDSAGEREVAVRKALAGGVDGAIGLHSIGRRADAYRSLDVESASSGECAEYELVRDVLFACQGIDGEHIKFSPSEQAYVISPNVRVSPGRRNLVKCLTETGWLFKRVTAALGEVNSTGIDVVDGDGSVRQAFRAAIQRELADYYKLMAVLEAQAQIPIVAYVPDASRNDGQLQRHGDNYLTLRRLFVWLAEPLKTMRTLAILIDATANKRGGAILTALHKFSKHGDPASNSLVRRILSTSATPFLGMIHRWTVSGELEDPCREFFVNVDHAVPDKDLWRQKYAFEEDMLPPFINRERGKTILRLGKNINFLRRCCDDSSWTEYRADIMNAVEKAGGLDYENPEGLDALVHEASKRVDTTVRKVFFERYRFGEHCSALKRYLLLGQGDLHECLMDLMGPELDRAASSLSVFKLAGTLEQAVRSSSAQDDESEFLDRLRVRLMPHLNEEIGWDVFTLEYVVNQPLTTVFTEHAMNKYLRVFNFLWRLKRVEHALCSTWTMMKPTVSSLLMRENEDGASGALLGDMLQDCHALRGEMHSFMSNFQYYVMFEVLEVSWADLEEKFSSGKDLDEIIAAHDVFLDSVVQKALLGSKSQLVLQTLYSLFEVMLTFREVAGDLFDMAADVVAKKAATRARIAERESNKQWGTYLGEDSTNNDFINQDAALELRQRLGKLRDDYVRALDGFLNLLPLQTHVDTQFLLFRLDFNEYYAQRGVGPGFDLAPTQKLS